MANTESNQHEYYMTRCIGLAKIAKARGDSPVGSLVVLNGKIIGEGVEGGKTQKDITYHSEIEAIRQAIKTNNTTDLSGCDLYTTHEPCIMCSYVIRHHKIANIIFGIFTGEIGGYSSIYPVLLDQSIKKWDAPPHLIFGILEKECRALHHQINI